jgi:NAD(P)-dependent dehydrogenase (short-subunit alcohol dehydrogenase family)
MTEPTIEYLENLARRKGIRFSKALKELASMIPARAIGDPEDHGASAPFLASEWALYIAGETFLFDGGIYSGLMQFRRMKSA